MSEAEDYRPRIYAKYLSGVRGEMPEPFRGRAKRFKRYYARALRGWLPADRGAAIADVACGDGAFLRALKVWGYRNLHGVDISPEQVKLAREAVPGVVEGDVREFLEGHPGEFDLLIGMDIIEHFRKDEVLGFLDSCHTALKPGGRLILQTPNADSPWGMSVFCGDPTHETCFSSHSLGWLMGLCGFDEIEARECGPRPVSISGLVRYPLWRLMRLFVRLGHLVEGGRSCRVLSSVFVIAGVRN